MASRSKVSVKTRGSPARPNSIHHSIKARLGYPEDMPDREVLRDWRERLLPKDLRATVRLKVSERKRKLRSALKSGFIDDRIPLDAVRRASFEKTIKKFKPNDYPETIAQTFKDGSCNIFGHICPVFFSAEAITETSTDRRRGRYIPFKVKLRVVRRDNHTCQHCGTHLKDDEVEFDHKIPLSRGGSSEEHNVRLTCFDCNRDKKNDVEI